MTSRDYLTKLIFETLIGSNYIIGWLLYFDSQQRLIRNLATIMVTHPHVPPRWATASYETPRPSEICPISNYRTPLMGAHDCNYIEHSSPNAVYSNDSQTVATYWNGIQPKSSGEQNICKTTPLATQHRHFDPIHTCAFGPTYSPGSAHSLESTYSTGKNTEIQLVHLTSSRLALPSPYAHYFPAGSDSRLSPNSSSELITTSLSPPLRPSRMSLQQQDFNMPCGTHGLPLESAYMGQPSVDKVHKLPDDVNCALVIINFLAYPSVL